jgi:enoyl-CoA hydratase
VSERSGNGNGADQTKLVKCEISEQVATITLNRPEKRNALSAGLLKEFDAALDIAEHDKHVRAIVIQGAGPSFCAGYDLTPTAGYEGSGTSDIMPGRTAEIPNLRRWFRLLDIPKPVIAKVHGYAVAGGCELAMMCDLVVGTEDCKIGYPIVRGTGTPPTLIWPWIIGMRKTKELLFTGNLVDGRRAVEMGMINSAVPADQLDAEVRRLTDSIRKVPPDLMDLIKGAITRQFDVMGLRSGLQAGFEMHILGHHSASVLEFMRIRQTEGLRNALDWRDQR